MKMIKYATLGALVGLSLIVSMTAHAQSSKRTELTTTGDKMLKLLTVHIVDKGKPMTVPIK